MTSAFTTFVILAGSGISGAMLERRDGDVYDSHRGSPWWIVLLPRDDSGCKAPAYTQSSLSSNRNISCNYTCAVDFVLLGANLGLRSLMCRTDESPE